VYVQPPVAVLQLLVAVRVHIDDCPADSGELRVVARSHLEGRFDQRRASELRKRNGETSVPVGGGGASIMRPLILHASSKATARAPRRVLHFLSREIKTKLTPLNMPTYTVIGSTDYCVKARSIRNCRAVAASRRQLVVITSARA
jgi:ectoine hydroxylase-related dioxygenase (phytanoyl-CoA dioxygenase family)